MKKIDSKKPLRNWRRAADVTANNHIALIRTPLNSALRTDEQIEILLRHAVVAGFEAGLKWSAPQANDRSSDAG